MAWTERKIRVRSKERAKETKRKVVQHRKRFKNQGKKERNVTERRKENGREETETERTQNSELYYSRIKILGICLFLQSVLANLRANTYTTTVRTLIILITMMKVTMIIYWRQC